MAHLPELKTLADQLFALGPERFGALEVESIGADADPDGHVLRDRGNMAVLAVTPADFLGRGTEAGPYRRRRPLRDRLEGDRFETLSAGQLLNERGRHVATELGQDRARVHRAGANAAALEALVEGDSEENVRRLRSAVGNKLLVGRPFEVRIVEIDV